MNYEETAPAAVLGALSTALSELAQTQRNTWRDGDILQAVRVWLQATQSFNALFKTFLDATMSAQPREALTSLHGSTMVARAVAMKVLGTHTVTPSSKPRKHRISSDAGGAQIKSRRQRRSADQHQLSATNVKFYHVNLAADAEHEILNRDERQNTSPETSEPIDDHRTYEVQYEDVSDEVNARLKLRDERRKEKKGDAKRKRQSLDVIDFLDVNRLAPARSDRDLVRPPAKRSRSRYDDIAIERTPQPPPQHSRKRKAHDHDGERAPKIRLGTAG